MPVVADTEQLPRKAHRSPQRVTASASDATAHAATCAPRPEAELAEYVLDD